MARLPIVGGDSGNWGDILNDYLTTQHNTDGTHSAITATSLTATSTVTASNYKRGTGSPEGSVTGSIGDLFLRTDGGAGTTLYVKESGSGNTGWVAVAAGGGATEIDDLSDVTIAALADEQFLVYDSGTSQWRNRTITDADLPAGIARDSEVTTAVSDHSADTTSVHGIADTSVLATDSDVSSAVAAHTGDATDAHDASAISFAPAGSIAATDVQAAIEEVASEAAATNLDDLDDVTLAALADEELLIYDSGASQWRNRVLTDTDIPAGIARDSEVTSAISAHESDTTNVHGIADTSALATDAELAAHESDTTSVHGIADTSVLATDTDVSTAVSDHSADTTSVHGIADTSALATATDVSNAVSTHSSDTTSVHGISDTSTLLTSLNVAVRSETSAYTATTADSVILCSASGGAFTVTLPTAVGNTGKVFHIKKTDSSANAVTIDGNGAQTIDGSTTVAISVQFASITIVSDNANWHII